MSEKKRYQANPGVSCGDEEDGAVLYNPDSDDTTVINLSGRGLWAFLETPRSVEEMAAYLVQTYCEVGAEQAAEDAAQFVQSLLPGFVLEVDDGA
jgi:hypothetical protein